MQHLIAQSDGSGIINLLLKFMGLTVGSLCGSYLYISLVLYLLAKKLGTPGPGLAWVPIGNLFLMCNMARRSQATVLLLLIPIVNLVAGAVLWMSIAENRGKPAWTGALVFIPIFGLLVPFYLLSGPAVAETVVSAPAPPRLCPSCGSMASPGEAFCGECGKPLPPAIQSAPRLKRTNAFQLAAVGAVLVAVFVGGSGAAGWSLLGSRLAYSPPKRTAPALPTRMAGSMKEFPIDTAKEGKAKPDAVVAETYLADGATSKVPETWLPKGVDRSSIPRKAKSLTAATYREKKTDKPVSVTVLEPRDGTTDLSGTIASEIGKTGGEKTGIEVTSPDGGTYTGVKVTQPQTQIYILTSSGTGDTIIIYASDPSVFDTADRLASNLGNGAGLAEVPADGDENPIFLLPPALPPGLTLTDVQSLTAEDVISQAEWREAESKAGSDAQVQQALAAVRQFLPVRWTVAEYRDGANRKWSAAILDYGDVRRTWLMMQVFRNFLEAAELRPVEVRGVQGWAGKSGSATSLIFQKGPYIAIVDSPEGTPQSALIGFGNGFQL